MSEKAKSSRPEEIFRENGGQLRMSEAIGLGITRYSLYGLLEKGIIEQIARGVYRLATLPPLSNPDLVQVSLRYPNAIVCLISALTFHGITTQIPHKISVAIPRGARIPAQGYPPLDVRRFSLETYRNGFQAHKIDGVSVKIYEAEKTLADLFKFRNSVGMDVVLEALKLYKVRHGLNLEKVLGYARLCRVEKVMLPYLESIL